MVRNATTSMKPRWFFLRNWIMEIDEWVAREGENDYRVRLMIASLPLVSSGLEGSPLAP